MGKPITKDEREMAKAIGLHIPYASSSPAVLELFSVDWDDFRSFKAQVKCPYCEAPQIITETTPNEIVCSGCHKPLELELGEIEIEATILLKPMLSNADRQYLAWKREGSAA